MDGVMAREEDEEDIFAGGTLTTTPHDLDVGIQVQLQVENTYPTITNPDNPALEDEAILHSSLAGISQVQIQVLPALPLSPALASRLDHQIPFQYKHQDQDHAPDQDECSHTYIHHTSAIRTDPSASFLTSLSEPEPEQEPVSTPIHKHHGRKEKMELQTVGSIDDIDINRATTLQSQSEEKIESEHEEEQTYGSDSECIGIGTGSSSTTSTSTRIATIVDTTGTTRRRKMIRMLRPPLNINTGGIKKCTKLSSIFQSDHHHYHQPRVVSEDMARAGMQESVIVLPLDIETTIHVDVPEPGAAIQEFSEEQMLPNQSNPESEQGTHDIRQPHSGLSPPHLRATFSEGRLQSIMAEDGNPSMQTSVSCTDLSRQSVPDNVPMFFSGAPSIPSYENTPSEPEIDDLLVDVATQSLDGSPWIHPSFLLSSSAADPASMQRATVFRPDRFVVEQVFSQPLPESLARLSTNYVEPEWEPLSVLSAVPPNFEPGSQPLGMPPLYSSLLAASVFSPRRTADSELLSKPLIINQNSSGSTQDIVSSSETDMTTTITSPQHAAPSIGLDSDDTIQNKLLVEPRSADNTRYGQGLVAPVDASAPSIPRNVESVAIRLYPVSIEAPASMPQIVRESVEELFKGMPVTEPEADEQVSAFPQSLAELVHDRNHVHVSITPRDSHEGARSARGDGVLLGEHDDDSVITMSPPAEVEKPESSVESESSLRRIFPVLDQFDARISDYIKKRDAVSEAVNEILNDHPAIVCGIDDSEQPPGEHTNPLVPHLLPWSSLISSEGLDVAERLQKLKYEERYDPIQESYQHYHMYPQHFSTSGIETASVTQSHSSSRNSLHLPSLNSSSFNSLKDADEALFKGLMRTRAISKPTWEIQRDVEHGGVSEQALSKDRSDIDDILSWRGDRSRPANTVREDSKPDFQTRTYFLGKFVDEVKYPVAEAVPNIKSVTNTLPPAKKVGVYERDTENECTDMKDKANRRGQLMPSTLDADVFPDSSEVMEKDAIPICGYNNYRISMAAYFREKEYLIERTPVLIRKVYDDALESAKLSQGEVLRVSETMEKQLANEQVSVALEPAFQTQNELKVSSSSSPFQFPSALTDILASGSQDYSEKKLFQASVVYDIGHDGHLVPWRESEHPAKVLMGLGLSESESSCDFVNHDVLKTEYPLPIPTMAVPLLSDFRGLVPDFSALSKESK